MKVKQAIDSILKLRKYTYEDLKNETKYNTVSGITNRLYGNISLAVLISILKPLHCEVVIRSTLKDKQEWVLEPNQQEE